VEARVAIDSISSLRHHLQWGLRVELSLAPLYLYAAYSLREPTSLAARLIISVAAEEMLHATLDANMLVAIGGRPVFSDPATAPAYPMVMPHHKPPILLELRPASAEVMDLFCTIEKPQPLEALPEDDDYETQGQFYGAIAEAFERFTADELFAANDLERQLGDPSYYAAVEFDADDSGGLELIRDMDGVRRALSTVIHQGEGLSDERWADPAHQELTHYYKFVAIRDGEEPLGEVWPVAVSPVATDIAAPLRDVAILADTIYSAILLTLDELYEPLQPETRGPLVGVLYTLMKDALGPTCRFLMSQPIRPGSATHAGPAFDLVEFSSHDEAVAELAGAAKRSAAAFPELAPVAAVIDGIGGRPSRR
jgi:hypothetical protein